MKQTYCYIRLEINRRFFSHKTLSKLLICSCLTTGNKLLIDTRIEKFLHKDFVIRLHHVRYLCIVINNYAPTSDTLMFYFSVVIRFLKS